MPKKNRRNKGSATVECAILMPIIFACIMLCIFIFIILYEKTLLQNYANDMVTSLSRQWGYKPLPMEEVQTGVYKKDTYESREMYWHLNLLGNDAKKLTAKAYIEKHTNTTGLLKPYVNFLGGEVKPKTFVDYSTGIPSTLRITIIAKYNTPAKPLLMLIGIKDYIVIEVTATSTVYDTKDMINTTDFVYQIVRETKTFKKFSEKIKPLKDSLDTFIKE